MGARQSIAQTQRQRTQSSTTLDDHADSPSTSAVAIGENSEIPQVTLDRHGCGREHRELRTRSVTIPDGETSTSDDNRPMISSSASGISALERLLRFSSFDGGSASATAIASTSAAHSSSTNASSSPSARSASSRNRTIWLRPFQFRLFDIQCPVCHKTVPSDDVEFHLVVCLTKPRLIYNEEVLNDDKEIECIICFDEMVAGDIIARLPCLCIYHKKCIDAWFKVKNVCPEHPGDD